MDLEAKRCYPIKGNPNTVTLGQTRNSSSQNKIVAANIKKLLFPFTKMFDLMLPKSELDSLGFKMTSNPVYLI